jgi:excisionase family DNA binding protein
LGHLLSTKEVSEFTGLSVATIYSYVCKKNIPHYKLGTRTMFKKGEIEQWINERYVKPITVSENRK